MFKSSTHIWDTFHLEEQYQFLQSNQFCSKTEDLIEMMRTLQSEGGQKKKQKKEIVMTSKEGKNWLEMIREISSSRHLILSKHLKLGKQIQKKLKKFNTYQLHSIRKNKPTQTDVTLCHFRPQCDQSFPVIDQNGPIPCRTA